MSQTIIDDEDRPMTAEEAAAWLRLDALGYSDPVRTMQDWADKGQIGSIKVGRHRMWTLRILRDYTRQQLSPAGRARR